MGKKTTYRICAMNVSTLRHFFLVLTMYTYVAGAANNLYSTIITRLMIGGEHDVAGRIDGIFLVGP